MTFADGLRIRRSVKSPAEGGHFTIRRPGPGGPRIEPICQPIGFYGQFLKPGPWHVRCKIYRIMAKRISIYRTFQRLCLLTIAAALAGANANAAEVQTRYLYHLSNFDGPVTSTWARIALDEFRNETYLIDQSEVRVFDANGMEIFRFGEDSGLGLILDVAVKKNGEILVLSSVQSRESLLVCDYRGMPLRRFSLADAPPEYSDPTPYDILIQEDRLYLVDDESLRIVVSDTQGRFLQGYDIAALLQIADNRRIVTPIDGFSVDESGRMLFSIPVLFSVYRLSPDGEIEIHKRPGSAPGKFNMVAGIVSDDRGNFFVADRLKNAILVFDGKFQFLGQFGYRGLRPDNLFGPKYLAIDNRNRLYVSQLREHGVSVFDISYSDSEPEGR